jgi:hypothetical protein
MSERGRMTGVERISRKGMAVRNEEYHALAW